MPNSPQTFGQKSRPREVRKNSFQRGYDTVWKKFRDIYIKNNPLCVDCLKEGRTTRGDEVDHITPFEGVNDPLRLDESNLQTLCKRHHVAKTWKDRENET